MPISIEVHDGALAKALADLPAKVNAEVALEGATEIASMGTRAFNSPRLRPAEWPPLAESYNSAKKKAWDVSRKSNRGRGSYKQTPLVETGALKGSLRVGGAKPDGEGFAASVTSDRPYAAYHQFGGNSKSGKARPPQRPFLPLKPGARGEIPKPLTLSEDGWRYVKRKCEEAIRRILNK